MPDCSKLKIFTLTFFISCVAIINADELPGFKPAPERPIVEASVVVEDQQFVDECEPESMCIEGNLFNEGQRTAYRVKLKVEVGGGKYAKPRTSFFVPLEKTVLEAGARQGYSATVKRKIPYKDKNGEAKTIEAGKYNVKLVPVWSAENKVSMTKHSRNK